MIIENKELYNLFKSVKTGYKDYEMSLNGYGLYVEGFIGGITVYAYNGAAYRKTIYGDNKEAFVSYWSGWQKKDGLNYAENLQFGEKIDNGLFTRIKASFEAERFNCFTVKAREFFKAVYAVDNVNKGEKRHEIIISAYDGNLDIASWNNGDFGRWQLDAPVQASGAVMVNRKFLDNIRNAGTLEFSCLEYNGKTGKKYKMSDIERGLRDKFNISYIAQGIRRDESLARRGMLKHLPYGIDEKYKKIYPIADFSAKDVMAYVKLNKLPMPIEYSHGWKRDFYVPDVDGLIYLKNNFPNDYKKVIAEFPHLEGMVWARTN